MKSKVFIGKIGISQGKRIARATQFDEIEGGSKTKDRHRSVKSDANDERDRLIIKIKSTHRQIQTGERMTFSKHADIFGYKNYKRTVIVEGRKIETVKSDRTAQT